VRAIDFNHVFFATKESYLSDIEVFFSVNIDTS